MTKQITVRLPDDLVVFIDQLVESGRFESRAAVVAREVKRLQRRLIAEVDAENYRIHGEDPELAGMFEHLAKHPQKLDD